MTTRRGHVVLYGGGHAGRQARQLQHAEYALRSIKLTAEKLGATVTQDEIACDEATAQIIMKEWQRITDARVTQAIFRGLAPVIKPKV